MNEKMKKSLGSYIQKKKKMDNIIKNITIFVILFDLYLLVILLIGALK